MTRASIETTRELAGGLRPNEKERAALHALIELGLEALEERRARYG